MNSQRMFWFSGSEAPWLLEVLNSIPDSSSRAFEDESAARFRALGYSVFRQFCVPDRGDGRRGYVDIVLVRPFVLVALELDRVKPRKKSIFKVQQVAGATTRLVYCRQVSQKLTP